MSLQEDDVSPLHNGSFHDETKKVMAYRLNSTRTVSRVKFRFHLEIELILEKSTCHASISDIVPNVVFSVASLLY